MNDQFTLEYAPSVIELLGIGLYKQLPQAIEELITNSWDADATEVKVFMDYENREIQVTDNGIGMSHEELNSDFLTVANNRRITKGTGFSPKGRLVTGKKGVGKLSLFGVANIIQVASKKNGKMNSFEMNYNKIKKTPSNEKYHPKSLITNKNVNSSNHGTKILLKEISLKNMTSLSILWESLARRFNKYSKNDFLVILEDSNKNKKILDEKAFIYSIKPKRHDFKYKFPDDFREEMEKNEDLQKLNDLGINGIVYTSEKPLKAKDTGFAILVRGKLAGEPVDYQFSDRANDYFYGYATGFFNMDFIDKDNEKNYISTDRQSILWDSDENLINVRNMMDKLINRIMRRWRSDRNKAISTKKNEEINGVIKSDNQINSVFNSSELSDSDNEMLTFVKKIMLDPKTQLSKNNEKKLLSNFVQRTDQYQKEYGVYSKLIPAGFSVPDDIGVKLQKIVAEATSIPCNQTEGDKFIISEGLLFRALIDATTSTLIEKNIEDMEDIKAIEDEIKKDSKKKNNKRASFGTTRWICNLPLRSRLKATIQFLNKKEELAAKKTEEVYISRLKDIIDNLDMLMHDINYCPDFGQLQAWWVLLDPILTKAFKYIKGKNEA